MKDIKLTPLEELILQRSSDSAITHRRKYTVLVSGFIFGIMIIGAAYFLQSWQILLFISLMYIAITVFEKIAYANAVLGYKSLIQKLKQQIEKLESHEIPQPQTDSN